MVFLFQSTKKKKIYTHYSNISISFKNTHQNPPFILAHCRGVCPSWFSDNNAWAFHRYKSKAVSLCPLEQAQLRGVQPRESCRKASTSHSSTNEGFSSRHRNNDTINLLPKMKEKMKI